MHPIEKYRQLLENITSNEQSLDEVFSTLADIKAWNEDLYLESINRLSDKVQKLSEDAKHFGIAALPFEGNQTIRRQMENLVSSAISKGISSFEKVKKSIPADIRKDSAKIGAIKHFFDAKLAKNPPKPKETSTKSKKKVTKEGLYNTLLNNPIINEGISSNSALKTRNDIIKLARRHTDSANIIAPSNFESYEDQDNIILKISIYDLDKNKLNNIKDSLADTLSSEGWADTHGIYEKSNMKVKFYEIKKAFRSGAYQNRETPHLGIAIRGPKRALLDSILPNNQ